jgi:hypothetical protein
MAWQMHTERSALVLRFFENCGYISHSVLRLENCNSISENFFAFLRTSVVVHL